MIIKNISLNRFKKFNDLEVSLLPGLNVIKGPNEAGKSTLHSAVIAGLFFNPSHRRAEIKNNVAWQSDKMYQIGITVAQNNQEFQLNKDFENKKVQMTGDGLQDEITDASTINQRLCDWLGFSSAAVFRSTACIEQDKISQVTRGDKQIGDVLQSTITGEDDAVANYAIEELQKALGKTSRESKKSDSYVGSIKKLVSHIDELEKQKNQVQAEIKVTARTNARLLEIEEELAGIDSVLCTKMNLKEKNERRRELMANLKVMEENRNHASSVLNLNEEIRTLHERLAAYEPFFKLIEEDIEQFYSLVGRKQSLEELQKSLEDQLEHPKQKVVQKRPNLNKLFIAGIVLLWIGLIGTLLTKFMLILAFAGLISLCAGIVLMISKSEVQIELSPNQIRNQINRASEQMNFVEESIKYFLSRTKCDTTQDFIARLERYRPLKKRKMEKDAELSGMIGDETVEDTRKTSKQLEINIRRTKEELQALDAFALDPEAYQRLLDEADRIQQQKSELHDEKQKLEIINNGVKPTNEDAAIIQEKLASLRQALELYKDRVNVCEKCLNCLETARERTLRSATNVLEDEIEKYISSITTNRYGKVKVDSDTLNVSVYSPEKHDYVDINRLSRATIDQIYLAARLGLVKLISGNKKPPLLLDDPFVAFDDNRLETTMELLLKIAQEYQILLFTCSNRYDQYADKVIDLRTYSVLGNSSTTIRTDETEIDAAFLNQTSIGIDKKPWLEH